MTTDAEMEYEPWSAGVMADLLASERALKAEREVSARIRRAKSSFQ